ncbi:MAG: phosphatase PAP2 family protein [Pseudomonadota bacterium]
MATGAAWWWAQGTRLGEAQILLPAMALALLWLARQPGGGRLALAWLGATVVATAITTASKIAFIGYGIGWALLDFTGFSGHAMFAAALLPLLLRLAAGPRTRAGRSLVLVLAYGLAGLVAVSRIHVGAHSASEVLSGFALGALASAWALRAGRWPALPLARWMPALLLAWVLLAVVGAPASRTHGLVTQLALALSGRPQAYQRWELHRDQRQPQALPRVSLQAG